MPLLELRPPTDREKSALSRGYVRGYIAERGRVVPLDDWVEGDELFVENCNASIQRSIYRMAKKAGFRVTCEKRTGSVTGLYFRRVCDVEPQKSIARTKYTRPWDRTLHPNQLRIARDRREHPDGRRWEVESTKRGDGVVRKYPWDKMRDGDYFQVAMERGTPREKRALLNCFREASCRYDYEIQVVEWAVNVRGEEVPGLRVTRIQEGLAYLKRRAAEARGERAIISDGGKVRKVKARRSTMEKNLLEQLQKFGVDEEAAKQLLKSADFPVDEKKKKPDPVLIPDPDYVPKPRDPSFRAGVAYGVEETVLLGPDPVDVVPHERISSVTGRAAAKPGDVLEVDTGGMDVAGSAYSKDYNKAAILKERMKSLLREG